MNQDEVSRLWTAYKLQQISRSLHDDDQMFNTAIKGWDDYLAVGVSAMQIISAALASGPSYSVSRILDFGCGYGRVARHLRAFFPDADLFVADIDLLGAEFCATNFGGQAVKSTEDFQNADLPNELDLIWLGSVFTHLDWGRMNDLFDALVASLRVRGTVVATFRGEFLYRRLVSETDAGQIKKWKSLRLQY